MKLARLTDEGIEQFRSYLIQLKGTPGLEPPWKLLTDRGTSARVNDAPEVPQRTFANRLEAECLDALIQEAEIADPERDAGLWTWLTLFYFDQLCPAEKGERKKVAEQVSYIPAIDITRRAYRHLLLGPWQIYRLHRKSPHYLRGLLWTTPSVATSETYRLFVENPTLLAAGCAVSAATTLYFDYQNGKMKRGAGRKDNGGCRRLIKFLQQLDCTFDLPAVTEDKLIQLLPKEFRSFIPAQKELFDPAEVS